MHIPDAVLDPRVVAATGTVGVAGLYYGLRSVERQLAERTTALMGMMAAFVFATQMINFPAGPGVSGHLLGGVLTAVMLGPWAGAVVIASVLIVQCFLCGDGGFTALGANFVNMGLIGSVGGYAIYAPIRRAIGGPRGILVASMVAAWFTVLLAAGAFAIELAAGGNRAEFFRVLSWMALVHAVIGVGEAIITGLVVRFILLTRPDLIYSPGDAVPEGLEKTPHRENGDGTTRGDTPSWNATLLSGVGIALALAVFLAPFASENPDGLEYVGEKLNFLPREPVTPIIPAPIPDYQLSLPIQGTDPLKVATAAAGLVGTLVVFAFAWGLGRVFVARKLISERIATPDAA